MRVVVLIGMLFALSGSASAMDLFSHHSPMPGSEGGRGHHADNGGGGGGGGGSYGAPEPVTTVALAIGAGAAGLAAWRRRKSR